MSRARAVMCSASVSVGESARKEAGPSASRTARCPGCRCRCGRRARRPRSCSGERVVECPPRAPVPVRSSPCSERASPKSAGTPCRRPPAGCCLSDVAVQDPGGMRLPQRLRQLADDPDGPVSAGGPSWAADVCQRAALDQAHAEKGRPPLSPMSWIAPRSCASPRAPAAARGAGDRSAAPCCPGGPQHFGARRRCRSSWSRAR